MATYRDSLNSALASLTREAKEDYVALSAILWEVRRYPELRRTPEVEREATMELLARLLSLPGATAGQFASNDPSFTPWQGSGEQILERVRQGWDRVGRPLVPGDVVWLTINDP
jgi:hypothetical protein